MTRKTKPRGAQLGLCAASSGRSFKVPHFVSIGTVPAFPDQRSFIAGPRNCRELRRRCTGAAAAIVLEIVDFALEQVLQLDYRSGIQVCQNRPALRKRDQRRIELTEA